MKIFKLISSAIKYLVSLVTPKKRIEYQVENTLDFIHDIKKDEIIEAEKALIEAKVKLRERRKAPKKIKVPKDPA